MKRIKIGGAEHSIYDAADAFKAMGVAQERVETAEESYEDCKKRLDRSAERLQKARDEFDKTREVTLEFCPAIETGYAHAKLTETVGVVDGKVTVIPIGDQKDRPARPRSTKAEIGAEETG